MQHTVVFALCSGPTAARVARPVSYDQNSTRACNTTLHFFPSPSFDKLTRRMGGCRKNHHVLGSVDYVHINYRLLFISQIIVYVQHL